jgi:hypothetical protein
MHAVVTWLSSACICVVVVYVIIIE